MAIVAAAASHVDRPVREPLRVAEHRRQRRLQLVADREQERALGVARVLELLAMSLNDSARDASSAAPSAGTAAGAHPPRVAARVGDAAHRPRDPAREQQRDAAASATPIAAAISSPSRYGRQAAAPITRGRSSTSAFPATGRAA